MRASLAQKKSILRPSFKMDTAHAIDHRNGGIFRYDFVMSIAAKNNFEIFLKT